MKEALNFIYYWLGFGVFWIGVVLGLIYLLWLFKGLWILDTRIGRNGIFFRRVNYLWNPVLKLDEGKTMDIRNELHPGYSIKKWWFLYIISWKGRKED